MTDWIEGYKLGFKEGVVALKMQLKEKGQYSHALGCEYYTIEVEELDEICKELVDE